VVTLILVHGAGDTGAVWNEVQQLLSVPSHALDLPGRGRNPSDLSRVTVAHAVEQAVGDINELTSGPIVLVAHSIGGAVSPGIAAQLSDRVVHLVHIAAVAATDGALPLATASQEFADRLLADADALRRTLNGATFTDGEIAAPLEWRSTDDRAALARIDSLNFGCVPTSWAGVAPTMGRTFIQPLRDRLYPANAQARLAAAMCANEVITVDAGHNVARSWPAPLAAILREITSRYG
jgi:pimeloyl-ACP methyl ester carboxylesterase